MLSTGNTPSNGCACPGIFATTHWSLVLKAGRDSGAAAREAMECLCRAYWQPVYLYIRARADGEGEAEDLTQEFFARLLDGNCLAQVDPLKGRFRSFLFAAINHFLSNERDRVRARKRGGSMTFLSLDDIDRENRAWNEPATDLTPEKIYEQRWASALLAQVLARLRGESAAEGNAMLFDELKGFLIASKSGESYSSLAGRLGTTEAAVKMRVLRLRRRYAELVREEIASTLADPNEAEEEQRHLLRILSE